VFLILVFSTVGKQETKKRKSIVGGNKNRVYTSLYLDGKQKYKFRVKTLTEG